MMVSVSLSIFETIFIKSQSQCQNLIAILKVSVSVSKIEIGYTESQSQSRHAKTGLALFILYSNPYKCLIPPLKINRKICKDTRKWILTLYLELLHPLWKGAYWEEVQQRNGMSRLSLSVSLAPAGNPAHHIHVHSNIFCLNFSDHFHFLHQGSK